MECTEGEEHNLHALALFLRVSPALEKLTVSLKDCCSLLHKETEVRLPNLWSLTTDCRLDDDLPQLLKRLRLPRLQALSVTLDIRSEDELSGIREDEGKFVSSSLEFDKDVKTVTLLGVIIRKRPPPHIWTPDHVPWNSVIFIIISQVIHQRGFSQPRIGQEFDIYEVALI